MISFFLAAFLFSEMTAWDLLKGGQSRGKEECGLMETSMNSISLQTGCGDPEIFLKYPSTVCALCYTLIARLCENEGTVCDSPI